MTNNLIEVRELSKYFAMPGNRQLRAVDRVSFDIAAGELFDQVQEIL